MGGLRKYMPITWITFLIGTLALVGTPFFSGFYSKENLIEAAHAANVWGADFAYWAVLIGVFVTSLYSFRVYFLVFHGKERFLSTAMTRTAMATTTMDMTITAIMAASRMSRPGWLRCR